MAKIKSTVQLNYDSRTGKVGIIQLEVNDWKYEPQNSRYIADVYDYLIENIEVETETGLQTIERKTLIHNKKINYNSTDIDNLFYMLNNPIELTESYTLEMDNLISMALLYVTQQEPIYGSLFNEWEII